MFFKTPGSKRLAAIQKKSIAVTQSNRNYLLLLHKTLYLNIAE
jgi:hypothetical protein